MHTKTDFDYIIYDQALCPLLDLCSLSENISTSIPDHLLFYIQVNRTAFFKQKRPKCLEVVEEVLANELGSCGNV